MRKIALALFIIVILALLAAPASAQELVPNTPAATAAGPVVVNPPVVAPVNYDLPATNTLLVIGIVLALGLAAISQFLHSRDVKDLIAGYKQILADQHVIDEGHRRYTETSLPVQQYVELFRSFVNVMGSANLPVIDPAVDATADYLNKIVSAAQLRDTSTAPSNPAG